MGTRYLVVVDMQNDFCGNVINEKNEEVPGVLSNEQTRAVVQRVADEIKKTTGIKNGGMYDRLYFTRDTHVINGEVDDYRFTQEYNKINTPHCIKGTPGWDINPMLIAAVNDTLMANDYKIINKTAYGSLTLASEIDNDLLNDATRFITATVKEEVPISHRLKMQVDFLRDSEIVVCGVCTGICVLANVAVLQSRLTYTNIKVLSDACACVTPETHKQALEAMKILNIDVE